MTDVGGLKFLGYNLVRNTIECLLKGAISECLLKGAIVHPLMLLNVNTYASSVIESSFALMKFMEVLMNVYLPYSFNC